MSSACAFEMDGFDYDDSSYGYFFDNDDQEEPDSSDIDTASELGSSYEVEEEEEEEKDPHSPILSPEVMACIAEKGFSKAGSSVRWTRLYSTSRDGDSFGTFLRKVRGQRRTVFVAKTSKGGVVGGCATRPWSGRGKQSADDVHDEHDQSFIFSLDAAKDDERPPQQQCFIPGFESPTSTVIPDRWGGRWGEEEAEEENIAVHKWESEDDDAPPPRQLCSLGEKRIALGGALSIEGGFRRGTAKRCDGFRAGVDGPWDRDEAFEVVNFEVYSLD